MRIFSYVPYACDGILVSVEADIRRAIPGIDITGLAAGAVREARERVRAAFRNSGFKFPLDRVLINLAPAGVKKDGAGLDLPIALAIMAAAGMIPPSEDMLVLGELELSGAVRRGRGVLPAVAAGLDAGISDFIVPAQNAAEASLMEAGNICGVQSLEDAVLALQHKSEFGQFPGTNGHFVQTENNAENAICAAALCGDFADVRGQSRYKRAMEIAAAGGHNLLVFGPPGAGKTMLARRIGSIMAPLTRYEAVEVTKLHSLAGQFSNGAPFFSGETLITEPPFRSPHHSASAEGILGGGKAVHPGEISLAHHGVLFLDEAPEFKVNVLQALREPLEDKIITISRAEGPVRLPADFQLIMAANPCPCGRLGMNSSANQGANGCFCSAVEIERYWKRFGGALMDRVELRSAVQSGIDPDGADSGETSAVIRKRVVDAVAVQCERFKQTKENSAPVFSSVRRNAGISAGMVRRFCPLTEGANAAFKKAVEKLEFSGRAYYSALRVARTIADLEGKDSIETEHILEAVQHRRYGEDPYDIFSAA
ncbi:MAG: YifB family Mg chelatase-like AAA ATPase [Spirochaetaceae bacterium]|jgi:magnesium chelatase family protein|nr:YifB family Mg chelatase-like AAA ATPase [Spirochaetaceae bacterium]